jgi:hypothetical protein
MHPHNIEAFPKSSSAIVKATVLVNQAPKDIPKLLSPQRQIQSNMEHDHKLFKIFIFNHLKVLVKLKPNIYRMNSKAGMPQVNKKVASSIKIIIFQIYASHRSKMKTTNKQEL